MKPASCLSPGAFRLAEWLVERGIGEERALLVDHGQAIAARMRWPGALEAGLVEDALLVAKPSASTRGLARFANGETALVDRLPRDAPEGATIRLVVTRPAMREAARIKPAQSRPSDDACRPAPDLVTALLADGPAARAVPSFPAGLWEDVWHEAAAASVSFAGGAVHISPTPAMTLIDVDGHLPPRALALAAVTPVATAIRRFDLAGSIGIDFPTLADKADRRAVDDAMAAALAGWPHERTAMNGFGFVQIVSRLQRPSLVHLITQDRAGAAARLLLRTAERVAEPGTLLICANPAVLATIGDDWRADLARRSGRILQWQSDSRLALNGGFAQAITS